MHCKPIVKKGKKHGHKQPPQFFGSQIIEVILAEKNKTILHP